MMKVLVVEDEEMIRKGIVLAVDWAALDCVVVGEASNGEEGLEAAQRYAPTLIITDLKMPKMDGITVLRTLRERGNPIPVLILTAKSEVDDKVLGLDQGADDYIAKPFGMMELMARVRTALRHAGQNQPKEKTYSLGSLFVDPERHIVRDGDRDVTLTLKEFQVLCLLMERAGTVFTRDQLLNTIWGYEFDGASRTVDVHIRTLRQKLGKSGDCIETVRGIGYKISAD